MADLTPEARVALREACEESIRERRYAAQTDTLGSTAEEAAYRRFQDAVDEETVLALLDALEAAEAERDCYYSESCEISVWLGDQRKRAEAAEAKASNWSRTSERQRKRAEVLEREAQFHSDEADRFQAERDRLREALPDLVLAAMQDLRGKRYRADVLDWLRHQPALSAPAPDCETCGGSGQTDDEYGPCPDCAERAEEKP